MEACLSEVDALIGELPASGRRCTDRFGIATQAIVDRLNSLREGLPCPDKAAQLKSLLR